MLELLIVVALIFVMFTLYFGGGEKGYQHKQIGVCGRNLENVYMALKTYSMDNNEKFPVLPAAATSEAPLSQLVPRSTTSTEFFICPGSKDAKLPSAEPFATRRISYAYYMGHTAKEGADQALMSDRQVNTNPKRAGEPLFSSDGKKPGNNHKKYGGNVMFCDGSVQASPAQAAFNLTNAANIQLLNPKP